MSCLQVDLAVTGETHDQSLTGKERLLESTHAADGVRQGRFPGDNMSRVHHELALNLLLDHTAIGVVEQVALTGTSIRNPPSPEKKRPQATEASFQVHSRGACQKRTGGQQKLSPFISRCSTLPGHDGSQRNDRPSEVAVYSEMNSDSPPTSRRITDFTNPPTSRVFNSRWLLMRLIAPPSRPERFAGRQGNRQIAIRWISTNVEFHLPFLTLSNRRNSVSLPHLSLQRSTTHYSSAVGTQKTSRFGGLWWRHLATVDFSRRQVLSPIRSLVGCCFPGEFMKVAHIFVRVRKRVLTGRSGELLCVLESESRDRFPERSRLCTE